MPTATIDEFDLDIRLGTRAPDRSSGPMMITGSGWTDVCCTDVTCSDCRAE
ncbi:hypothetical protein OG474_36395 [Kribbella sp. NBC_01505]|uniref:hypothetical protein n=1 Tax=Kribbella sp. NBC_01505 TaxID=2903580 RepID=UPI0038658D10